MTSPYRAALGGIIDALHPRLRAYFDEIPPGHVGRGSGVFDVVGARNPLLWPFLELLEREGVAVARFGRRIRFEVENRPGHGASVHARRTMHFTGLDWVMVDAIAAVPGASARGHRMLVDDLGTTRRIRAAFSATTDRGALLLTSTRIGVRLGRARLTIPRPCAPVVTLEERFDDDRDAQHVDVRIRVPLLGTVYRYAGWFTYRVELEGTHEL